MGKCNENNVLHGVQCEKIPLVKWDFLLVKVVFCILKHLELLSWGVGFDGFFTDK